MHPHGLRRARSAAAPTIAFLLVGCAPGYLPPEPPSPDQIPALEGRFAAEPANLDLATRLAAAYRAGDRPDEARTVLEAVLERDPDHEGAIWFLGITYEEVGADSSALALYRRYQLKGDDAGLREAVGRRARLVERRLLEVEVRSALQREAELADVEPRPGTVAVFPFYFTGDDPSLRPLGRALSEMLTTDLSQTDRLVVLERLRAQALLDELQLTETERVDPATAARGGRVLGAAHVVQGRLSALAGDLEVEAHVVAGSPDQPESRPVVSASDQLERFFDLEKLLALGIYRTLGIELTAAERERVTRNRTESLEALLAFGLGLEAQDEGRYDEAAGHFRQAISLDPGFGPAATELGVAEDLSGAVQAGVETLANLGAALLDVALPENVDDALLALEGLVPGLLDRNPVAEILGEEGLGSQRAVLEIILLPPGGDR